MASKEAAARKHMMEKQGKPKKATKLRRLPSKPPKKGKK